MELGLGEVFEGVLEDDDDGCGGGGSEGADG